MNTADAVQILILIALLYLSGFFSSTETAMTTVNHLRIRSLADAGNKRAITMMRILEHSDKMLSAILIGNNIVNISASAIATTLTMRLFGESAVSIATGLMTLFVLIFGEITPKTIASIDAEKLSLRYAPYIWGLMNAITPLIFIVNKLSGLVLRLRRINLDSHEDTITEEDVRQFMDAGRQEGAIEEHEHTLINNVFDLSDSEVHEIMVPRADMITVDICAGYEDTAKVFREEKLSRLPVYQDSHDNIVGVINIKDFAFWEDREHFSVSALMYEPYFTYEYKKIAELLPEMRDRSAGITIVLDEYGTAVGMVTMEDLLEELVGQIRDEYDQDEETLIQQVAERTYLIEGSVSIDDVNNALNLSLESDDYDSIGGYIIGMLGQLPHPGQSIETAGGIILHVEKMMGRRIRTVRLTLPERAPASEKETD